MPDLLLEVGCEELPSSACREIIDQAPGLVRAALDAAGLNGAGVRVSVAPRRFALRVEGLPGRAARHVANRAQAPRPTAAFGPDGAPTKAAEGFARGQGVAVADLVVREDNGREFVYAELRSEGRAVADVVARPGRAPGARAALLRRRCAGATAPGCASRGPCAGSSRSWTSDAVPFELHGLHGGRREPGPPLPRRARHDRRPSASYESALRRRGASCPTTSARRAQIVGGLDAGGHGGRRRWCDQAGSWRRSCSWWSGRASITGRFDARHLRLPSRVLVTAMQGHQRYFPLRDRSGDLLPVFLAVSNGDPDHADVIARGNEDVLDARLQDAEFSFDRDL